MASLSALGGKNGWAESVRGAVGVRCPDLGGKRGPLLFQCAIATQLFMPEN